MVASTNLHDYVGLTFWLVVTALATWRVAYALVMEYGPFGLFALIRRMVGAQKKDVITFKQSNVFSCVWCLSFWIGLLLLEAPALVLLPLALACIVAWINELITRSAAPVINNHVHNSEYGRR